MDDKPSLPAVVMAPARRNPGRVRVIERAPDLGADRDLVAERVSIRVPGAVDVTIERVYSVRKKVA